MWSRQRELQFSDDAKLRQQTGQADDLCRRLRSRRIRDPWPLRILAIHERRSIPVRFQVQLGAHSFRLRRPQRRLAARGPLAASRLQRQVMFHFISLSLRRSSPRSSGDGRPDIATARLNLRPPAFSSRVNLASPMWRSGN